jgi:hypothetical protein
MKCKSSNLINADGGMFMFRETRKQIKLLLLYTF